MDSRCRMHHANFYEQDRITVQSAEMAWFTSLSSGVPCSSSSSSIKMSNESSSLSDGKEITTCIPCTDEHANCCGYSTSNSAIASLYFSVDNGRRTLTNRGPAYYDSPYFSTYLLTLLLEGRVVHGSNFFDPTQPTTQKGNKMGIA